MNALLALTLWIGCGGPDSEYKPPEGTTALPEERIAGADGEEGTSTPPDAAPENTPDLPDEDGDVVLIAPDQSIPLGGRLY